MSNNGAAQVSKDKILVVGSNAGSLAALVAKVEGINAKHGPFTAVICLGNLLGPNPSSSPADIDGDDNAHQQQQEAAVQGLLKGDIKFPVQTYFIQGNAPLPAALLNKATSDNGDIAENLAFLGKKAILTLASGLKIACFGGAFSLDTFTNQDGSATSEDPQSPFFTSASFDSFLSSPSLTGVDVLLLNTWPSNISRFSQKPFSETTSKAQVDEWGLPIMQKLLVKAQPKYAFVSSENLFWEREPFVYPATLAGNRGGQQQEQQQQQQKGPSTTRFLSVGHFGNTTKQRWFYAFNITPTSQSSASETVANATPCPLDFGNAIRGVKRSFPQDNGNEDGAGSFFFAGTQGTSEQGRKKRHGEPPQGYTCKICGVPGHFIQDCPEKVNTKPDGATKTPGAPPETYVCRLCNVPGHWIQDCPLSEAPSRPRGEKSTGPPKEISPDECWFCLSNPQVTKHLIASIGAETYLTLPKGQLVSTSDQDTLVPGGGHCLIIPIAHYPTLSSVPQEIIAPVYAEIKAYITSLTSFYAQYGCKPITWEVSRSGPGTKSGHAHIQICPVPDALAKEARRIVEEEASKADYDLVAAAPSTSMSGAASTTEDAGSAAVGSKTSSNGIESSSARQKEIELIQAGGNYFKFTLPDGVQLLHRIKPGQRFNLQFGRATAALILGTPARTDWKACAKADDEEAADCQAFKKAFARYDPSG